MPTLYKYISHEFLDAFIKHGEVLFRPLSYFKNLEESIVRGDNLEATRRYSPENGLVITKVETGEVINLPNSFDSSARDADVFVFCLSKKLDRNIATQFGTYFCVEILDSGFFLSRIRSALALRSCFKNHKLIFNSIDYYATSNPPGADWALPEKIVMSKPDSYQWQEEYRIAFGLNGAFNFQATRQALVPKNSSFAPERPAIPPVKLKLGNLSRHVRLHNLA